MTSDPESQADLTSMRSFDASLPMALLRARESSMRIFRPMLADFDLTEQQWRVLRALTAAGERLEPTELAERTCLLAPSLSRILAKLERRGLVSRTRHTRDHRRALLELSDLGRELVATIAPESERRYRFIEASFGADRLTDLLRELSDLSDALGE